MKQKEIKTRTAGSNLTPRRNLDGTSSLVQLPVQNTMKEQQTPSQPDNLEKKTPDNDSRPIWTPDANETRVINKAEALGLSLHRCVKDLEGIPHYGLFDEKNRLPDPAIQYCAPLDWMEKWLDDHQDIDRYVRKCRKRLNDSITKSVKAAKAGIRKDVPPPPKGTPAPTDLRARLDRITDWDPHSPLPICRIKD